ncbi:glutamate synthase large subunit [Pseudoclavibacter chungangensis]|uniref:Glutamate synthase large subunit n=1 Tax=Pseudoclavibacter chungangensis TaxID=587635 RepID=A0A7J5BQD2_9MICO|nr:glutamate synthase-related protein [Pseudoclavibacter chungangensis]KAB1655963.1 glutamate synthase large subunit [Pseudoclavibacter chungangensis]NYJ66409.1 glutamate synthase (NADPH/NADH) large chain [Pseudoclavibacter chungangensis]
MNEPRLGLYDPTAEHSACGVGFITRKSGVPDHDVIRRGHQALCAIPHRGGMSSEGVGDGAGVSIDLSASFFGALVGRELAAGRFGVCNVFLPDEESEHEDARRLVRETLTAAGLTVELERELPVDDRVIRAAAVRYQKAIVQWVFTGPAAWQRADLDRAANRALLEIEQHAYGRPELTGLYPLSLGTRTQVLKGRLNANEVIPYFVDLLDERHTVRTLYFHTRFSTNTEPRPSMAQPFRLMAHNGELNTDRKNRLSDETLARARSRDIVRPPGQSDSSRLDQTLQSRVFDDGLDLVEAVVALMPPAWENDTELPSPVRDMLEFFSLYEEKNDGPAALIFSDGDVIGARLDRLGLRPLRTTETDDYLMVSSESGQLGVPAAEVIRRGRIEAGGMLHFDHRTGRAYRTGETLELLAARRDYGTLLGDARRHIDDIPLGDLERGHDTLGYDGDLALARRYVAYAINQESFRFMMDPMLADGAERISAMGYGNAINALADQEGGMAKYFSQRFAQVTNPPLDSIREADGMTFRVALGAKPGSGAPPSRQIVVDSPILSHLDMVRLREQEVSPLRRFDLLYVPVPGDESANAAAVLRALDALCDEVEAFASELGGIAVLTDRGITSEYAPLPLLLAVAAVDQRLIETGLRLRVSLVAESGQLPSSHHIAAALGFGASAVYSLSARLRAEEKYPSPTGPAQTETDTDLAFARFRKAALKSLAKTMGRVGLCTVESYIGGAFFEPNYLDTRDPVLARCFPHLLAPVGGVGFARIAQATTEWHDRARTVASEQQIPLLGLFKERQEGAGHSFGATAVRGFTAMTEERPTFAPAGEGDDALRLLTLGQLGDAFGLDDEAYQNAGYDELEPEQIDAFRITPGYRDFVSDTEAERARRPSALRDVLSLPADARGLRTAEDFERELGRFSPFGNIDIKVRGMSVGLGDPLADLPGRHATLRLDDPSAERVGALAGWLGERFPGDAHELRTTVDGVALRATGALEHLLSLFAPAPEAVALDEVQPAHEITRTLASGAMSHGALVATAHESVAHGTNMVGGMSNCGEGGEHFTRAGTIRGSRIKQFASGRFGIWAGYLADPQLQELEIKIGQGAKPGEGGQLPAPKVTVDIAAARGGTPGVELVSPPPHHDTYSIEDLAQLIHDCKAARVRVIVKLVSSEGIGTIAVGVAKAGADVINVAGNTGGTGAAAVTSLKYAGRSAEIGVAEVHQALLANGLRRKVTLRCSGAHQTGRDVVVSALLGGDSFEFGTTALMMLKCVMAKNCNIKCPARLTTNPEVFDGDPRALAQYLLNIAHDVRELLAHLGLRSLREARGRSDLLQLLDHPSSVGSLDVRAMLQSVPEKVVTDPVYLEKHFATDDALLERFRALLVDGRGTDMRIDDVELRNSDKSVGGQFSIDVERLLNHELDATIVDAMPATIRDDRGRARLGDGAVHVRTHGSAGQSYGAFCNDGVVLEHAGTANDGVAKSQSGGTVTVRSAGGGADEAGGNVLIGNFALFGATGGRLFVQGEAGDRFAVRNSGASAVVEGVGEFACEYMTNGAVLNLGEVGKGFGNGMSGGFAYQYDPHGRLPGMVSGDSLLLFPITDTAHGAFHEQAVRQLLGWHLEATGSPLAARILDEWATEHEHIVCGMPRALLLYQDADEILAAKSRKELLDELATSIAVDRLRAFKHDWRDRRTLHGGRAPRLGERGDMFALLSSYTVLAAAREVAAERVPEANGPDDLRVQAMARRLIMTEDFFVRQRVQRHLREALDRFEDAELAGFIAAKRLDDYKRSLALRNVRGIDAPGTYGWILHQDRKNAALTREARFDELIATSALDDLATQVASERPEGIVA